MKAVALLLLIANLVFFAWHYPQQQLIDQGVTAIDDGRDGADEPGQTLMMLGELPAAVAEKVVTVDLDKSSRKISPDRKQSSSAKSGSCWALGPFSDARQADRGLSLLTGRGIKGRTSQRSSNERVGYRVRLSFRGDHQAGQALLREMEAKGVRDIALVPVNGQFIVALGFFKQKESAQKRVKYISGLGYTPVLDDIKRKKQAYWVNLYPATRKSDLDSVWTELSSLVPGIRRDTLKCP